MSKKLLIFITLLFCSSILTSLSACTLEIVGPSPKVYTVTFDAQNGQTTTQEVEHANRISPIPTPVLKGYRFKGWYLDELEWSFMGYVVTQDMTLTAKWEKLYGVDDLEWDGLTYTVYVYLDDGITPAQGVKLALDFYTPNGENETTSPVTSDETGRATFSFVGVEFAGTPATYFVGELPIGYAVPFDFNEIVYIDESEYKPAKSLNEELTVICLTKKIAEIEYVNFVQYTKSLDNSYYTVTNFDGTDTEIIIQAQINGLPVTQIGSHAFSANNEIVSITIPNSVNLICDNVISDCNYLLTINYNGTVYEWTMIAKGLYWDYGTASYTIYCSDGKIAKDGTATFY